MKQRIWVETAIMVMVSGVGIVGGAKTAQPAIFQDHHSATRGDLVMGFDQTKTTHHFHLYTDGGAIEVTANDADDASSREAIQAHLPHIAEMFGSGNFEAPMEVHAQNVAGTAELASLKKDISYRYVPLSNGGRVDIVTRNAAAIAAVHKFLRFQISDHRTGDSTIIMKRPSVRRP